MSYPSPSVPPSPKKMSTGKKVGIGAGGIVAVLTLLGLIGNAIGDKPPTNSQNAAMTQSATSTAAPTSAVSESLPAPTPVASTTDSASAALAQLNKLAVKGRAPKTGYTRSQFGQPWSDDVTVESGHNGCDTRNDVLRRDLTDITVKPGTRGCVVLKGTLHDPYTGTNIGFTRGQSTSSAVQIDHALSEAVSMARSVLPFQNMNDMPLTTQSVRA